MKKLVMAVAGAVLASGALVRVSSLTASAAEFNKAVCFDSGDCVQANSVGKDGIKTQRAADTVVYGTIRTAETDNPVAEAVAVKDGKYVYVGDESGVAAFVKDGVTKVVDHRGKGMVMPGCTDGHSHYVSTFAMGNMKGGILFDTGDDKKAVLRKLSEATRKAKAAGKRSLCGFGWNVLALRMADSLTLAELDEATHGVSTVIFDSSGHHAYCNSECLKRCGIIDDKGNVLIKMIDGGVLELNDHDYPTGYVNERVTGYLTRMGGIDADELVDDEVAENAILQSQELLLSTGYTAAMDGWSNQLHPRKFYEVACRMDHDGTLKLLLPMTYEVEPWQTNMTEEIDYLASLNEKYRTAHVLPEYLKVFMDGVVETGTGATIKPYKDGSVYQGFWSVDRLADITRECNAKGLTVHTHVMGDAAIRDVTTAYVDGGDGTHRNCLVHLRNVRKEDFQRIASNNIACTAGLTWHAGDAAQDEYLSAVLDDEYAYHAYPIKSFFDAGVKVSSHSDYAANFPCPQDPFGIMHVAVNGLLPNPGETDYQFDPDELVTLEQAFQALTINGAWQLGLENERGSIKVGKWADFVLADRDVFTCAKTDIGKTQVVSTWFEGEEVYQAEDVLGEVTLTPTGLVVESKSRVTATLSGLPRGLKFNKKTLAITGTAKAAGTKTVKLTVKNASGYTLKQSFLFTVAADGTVTVEPADDQVRTGEPVTLRGDAALGRVKDSKVYVAGKKASIWATPAKGAIFLGWYEDAAFAKAATSLPKGYLTAAQSVVVPEGGLKLFARFAELKPWAVGTFDGVYWETVDETNLVARGTVTFTVSSRGKVSGKTQTGGKNFFFRAKAFDDVRVIDGAQVFVAHPTVKVGKATKTLTLHLFASAETGLGAAEILYGENEDAPFAQAVQNGWKLKPAALPAFPTGKGALMLRLENGITLKFGAKGKVTVTAERSETAEGRGTVYGVWAKGTTCVLPVAWRSTMTPNLLAQVPVYVAPTRNTPDFCAVYDVLLTVGESGKFDRVQLLMPSSAEGVPVPPVPHPGPYPFVH